jgi:hypothetical protein
VNVHGIRHRPPADRGEAIVGYVVLVPVVLFVLMLGIQAAVYFHAANIAAHAGARSVAVASRRGSGSAQGVLEARSVIAESGSVPLSVQVTEADTVRAVITVRVDRVVPFFPDRVTRIVSAPKERYITEDQR